MCQVLCLVVIVVGYLRSFHIILVMMLALCESKRHGVIDLVCSMVWFKSLPK